MVEINRQIPGLFVNWQKASIYMHAEKQTDPILKGSIGGAVSRNLGG